MIDNTAQNIIDRLIAKVLSNNATPKEINALEVWKNTSEFNQNIFKKSERVWRAKQDVFNRIDLNADREQVHQKIISKLSVSNKNIWNWVYRIAAVLFIPLLLGAGYLFYDLKVQEPEYKIFTIVSKESSLTQCYLADGTKVWLNKNSKIAYNSGFGIDNRNIDLDGEGYFEVTKNKDLPFVIKANKSQVKVLGTSFNVKAYKKQSLVEATLDEGSIEFTVNNRGKCNQLRLKPGEQVQFDVVENKITVAEVDGYMSSAWRYGKYIFKDETLENIAHEIEKIYKVHITFSDSSLKKLKFRGMLEHNHTVFDALEKIEKTTDLTYEIKGRNILLRSKN